MTDFRKYTAKAISKGVVDKKEVKSIGTAFLISPNQAITAAHVIESGNKVDAELSFNHLPEPMKVKGKAIDLDHPAIKHIDAVLLQLDQSINLPAGNIFFVDGRPKELYRWNTYAYPVVKPLGEPLRGYVNQVHAPNLGVNWDIELVCDNNLSRYQGASGASLWVHGSLVGVLIEQSNNTIAAISTKKMTPFLHHHNIAIQQQAINLPYPKELNIINNKWFQDLLDKSLHHAEPRYTPKLNVEVPLKKYLAAFSQSELIFSELNVLLENLDKSIEFWQRSEKNEGDWGGKPDFPKVAKTQATSILEGMSNLRGIVADLFTDGSVNLSSLTEMVTKLVEENQAIEKVLVKEFQKEHGKGSHKNKAFLQHLLEYNLETPARHIERAETNISTLLKIVEFLESPLIGCYFSKKLVITGAWGMGKTHSICDYASDWIDVGGHAIVLFGEWFRNDDIWTTIKNKLDLPPTVSTKNILSKLNEVGAETNKPLLFFIDALNETKVDHYWHDNLKSFLHDFDDFPYIRVALSCRTSYINKVFPDNFLSNITQVEHKGFEDMDYEASLAFFDFYRIEKPSFPLMNPEFSNPLFLRLFCEAIQDKSSKVAISQEYLSITKLTNAFLKRKNKEISEKIDVFPQDQLVQISMKALASKYFTQQSSDLLWSDAMGAVMAATNEDKSTTRRLLDHLIKEHLIREDENEQGQNIILFSFERLYEQLAAQELLKNQKNASSIAEEFEQGGQYAYLIADKTAATKYAGILESLSIIIAEEYKQELFVLTGENKFVLKPSLQGMSWRSNDAFFSATETMIVTSCLTDRDYVSVTWQTLICLATRQGCLLNADFLHGLLAKTPLAERDLTWSAFLFNKYKKDKYVTRTVGFALKHHFKSIPVATAIVWSQVLLWFCSSNDRRLRDYSTRALTNILEHKPSVAITLFQKFTSVNDDYVLERCLLAIYGAFIRNPQPSIISRLIQEIYETYFGGGGVPVNVLISDHVRVLAEFALVLDVLPLGISIDIFRPPFNSEWPLAIPSDEEIEKYKDTYWELPKLYQSCFYDDFAKYTANYEIRRHCEPEFGESCKTPDGFTPHDFKKWIFQSVLSLGYSEKFSRIDGKLLYDYGGGRAKPFWAERFGKKYQNISLCRLLGHMRDNLPIVNSHSDIVNPVIPPLQGNSRRELDPTLGHITKQDYEKRGWNDQFEYDFSDYFNNTDNPDKWLENKDLPEPSGLIELEDNNASNWFLLKGYFDKKHYLKRGKSLFSDEYIEMFVFVRAYLVKADEFGPFWDEVNNRFVEGVFIPGEGSIHEGFVGEYPWGVTFTNIFNEEPEIRNGYVLPQEFTKTYRELSVDYEYDASLNKEGEIVYRRYVPSEVFFEDGDLYWNKKAAFQNKLGKTCFLDPSVFHGGRSMLLGDRQYLEDFCAKKGYTLVWAIYGEKMVIGDNTNLYRKHYNTLGYANNEFITSNYKIASNN